MNPCPQTEKFGYATATDAWKVLKKRGGKHALATHKQVRSGGHVYRCIHCHPWHLTRQTHHHAGSTWPKRRHAAMERAWIERELETRG